MLMGKVFKSGNSQAVRIPKELQFDCDEVVIERQDDGSLLLRKKGTLPKEYSNVLEYLVATAPKKRKVSNEAFESLFKTAESTQLTDEKVFG